MEISSLASQEEGIACHCVSFGKMRHELGKLALRQTIGAQPLHFAVRLGLLKDSFAMQ